MSSFISTSKRRLLLLFVVTLVAFAIGLFWGTRIDPETRFWSEVVERRDAYAAQLDSTGEPKIIFTGGSSAGWGFDTTWLNEEADTPALNVAIPASVGPYLQVEMAFRAARPGDVVVISLEPDVLSQPSIQRITQAAARLALRLGEPGLATGRALPSEEHVSAAVVQGRPDLRDASVWFAKFILRREMTRIHLDEITPSGHVAPAFTRGFPVFTYPAEGLGPDARELLADAYAYGTEHGIKVLYTLPWICIDATKIDLNATRAEEISEDIAEVIPVVETPLFGLQTERSLFLDTPMHLSPEAARERTQVIYEALTQAGYLPLGSSRAGD